MWNRSVPTDAALPPPRIEDLAEAIAWLTTTFEFAEHYKAMAVMAVRRSFWARR